MSNFRFWRFIGAAIIFVVVAQIIHMLDPLVAMDYYKDPAYFSVWSKLMMPSAGPPPASFVYYSMGFSLVGAVIFVLVYHVLKNGIPGKDLLGKGLVYGLLTFLVADLCGAFAMILLFNLPLMLILLWTLESLIIKLVMGAVTAKVMK